MSVGFAETIVVPTCPISLTFVIFFSIVVTVGVGFINPKLNLENSFLLTPTTVSLFRSFSIEIPIIGVNASTFILLMVSVTSFESLSKILPSDVAFKSSNCFLCSKLSIAVE